jgi:hypothetical protein
MEEVIVKQFSTEWVNYGTKVCRMVEFWCCDLCPWTNVKFCFLNKWRFVISICRDDVFGDTGVVELWCCDLWLWPKWSLTLRFPSALYLLNEWRFFIGICRDDVLGDKGVSCGGIMAMWPLTLVQWPWTWNYLLLCIRPEQMQILNWYLQGWSVGGQRCVAGWNCGDVTLDGKITVLQPFTFHLCPTYCLVLTSFPYYIRQRGCFPAFVLTNALHLVALALLGRSKSDRGAAVVMVP